MPTTAKTQPKPPRAKNRKAPRPAMPRYKQTKVCKECGTCSDGRKEAGERCKDARVVKMRSYGGIRHTADGFDCALPVTIDSHSACSFGCLYCFSDNLYGHKANELRLEKMEVEHHSIGQMNLNSLDQIFSGGGGKYGDLVRRALRYDKRNKGGYPCPVQVGGLNDPMDNIERNQGWFLEFCKIAIKHNQPVRISTKGDLFLIKEYRDVIAKAPHLFWVAFSIITPDDQLLDKVDCGAPNCTQRLAAMKAAVNMGASASLRLRPMIPGITDVTARHPNALKELIDKSAEAGAKAVSAEVIFYPGSGLGEGVQAAKFKSLERLCGIPLEKVYRSFGKISACTRPAAKWTEAVMHKVQEYTHANGMTLGVSDPVWKQLTDSGCCCGILPENPVFGNWEQENATNAMLKARLDPDFIIKPDDIIPSWAWDMKLAGMCMTGVGPKNVWKTRHDTWGGKLLDGFKDFTGARGPWGYFQGALEPVTLDDGSLGYKYKGLKREFPKETPFWKV